MFVSTIKRKKIRIMFGKGEKKEKLNLKAKFWGLYVEMTWSITCIIESKEIEWHAKEIYANRGCLQWRKEQRERKNKQRDREVENLHIIFIFVRILRQRMNLPFVKTKSWLCLKVTYFYKFIILCYLKYQSYVMVWVLYLLLSLCIIIHVVKLCIMESNLKGRYLRLVAIAKKVEG